MSEYKRLTERDEWGNADIIGVESGNLQGNLMGDEFNNVTLALNRFAELEDKIESGQLVEIPCKVGDTVYLIYSSEQKSPISFVVDSIITHKLREEERLFVYDRDGYGGRFGDCCKGKYIWYIGTNKFQAEARLKELRGEE